MPFDFHCPHCNALSRVDDQYAGAEGPCIECGEEITLPGERPYAVEEASMAANTSWMPGMITIVITGLFLVGGPLLMIPSVAMSRDAARRTACQQSLRMTGQAMNAYHDTFKYFPPSSVLTHDVPFASWRSLLAPYGSDRAIGLRIDKKTGWESSTNRILHQENLQDYQCEADRNPMQGFTSYLAPVSLRMGGRSPVTIWGPNAKVRQSSVTDGMACTIAVVEAPLSPWIWIEPRDLSHESMPKTVQPQPTGKAIASFHTGGANSLFVDGSVRFLPLEIDGKLLGDLLTRADGTSPLDEVNLLD